MHDDHSDKTVLPDGDTERDAEAPLFMLNCYDVWSATAPAAAGFDCETTGE